ncbi:MAG: hypothetical protein K8W52_35805 [Deltaproteobacteria bacterium]|nr:hypothetical protein [Deltaproteobacteria bacterium]
MRTLLFCLLTSVAACATDPGTSTDPQPGLPLPTATGAYVGSYVVPTTTAPTDAATFPVTSVEWTVVDGVATLHYDLPVGLVGGKLPVSFSGPISPGATLLTLTGDLGVATCAATATTVTCHEVFGDLGALPINMAIVEQMAVTEYAGPVADRINVALGFSSDPIGNVTMDLQAPIVDDHGGA